MENRRIPVVIKGVSEFLVQVGSPMLFVRRFVYLTLFIYFYLFHFFYFFFLKER